MNKNRQHHDSAKYRFSLVLKMMKKVYLFLIITQSDHKLTRKLAVSAAKKSELKVEGRVLHANHAFH